MKPIIISSLYLLILFCLSKFVFEPSYLFYEVWWLDIPMHILGGFGVACLASAVLVYVKKDVSFWKLLVAYLIVATIWEIYEYVNHIVNYVDWAGVPDTIKDFIDGALGATAAYFFTRK